MPPEGESVPQRKHRSRKWIIIPCLVILIIVLAVGGALILRKGNQGIPKEVANQVTFPLYYPSELPSGFTIPKNAYSVSDLAVIFYAQYDNGQKKLFFSEQPKPQDFDFDSFNTDQLSGTKEIISRSGKAVVGLAGQVPVASLVQDKTWVLIRAPQGISANQLESITENLLPNPN